MSAHWKKLTVTRILQFVIAKNIIEKSPKKTVFIERDKAWLSWFHVVESIGRKQYSFAMLRKSPSLSMYCKQYIFRGYRFADANHGRSGFIPLKGWNSHWIFSFICSFFLWLLSFRLHGWAVNVQHLWPA